MCGIAGILNLGSQEPVGIDAVAVMCQALRHRGPDDEGVFLDGNFGMGMRRLSIIDLFTGRQPIPNEDASVWTVFNGEIYNFLTLRSELVSKGHLFRTNTDTEVIVHLYEEYGTDFVRHLAGMFAIALWDKPRQRLVLARDRLGIKPLFYAADSRRLLFGSEIKALLRVGARRDIDFQALHDYLSLNYIPGPRTIFAAVSKLPPAHLLVCEKGKVAVRSYWEIPYPGDAAPGRRRSEQSACEELGGLLRAVVRQHLISDVPLGVFLSGGIDSSSLVALMSEVSGQSIRTFSIGFEESSYNELGCAREVARRFGTEHHEMLVRPNAVELLPELIRFFDEPFGDSSAIPVYCVSKLASKQVKVALSGEGGDEVFAGYETYAACRVAQLYQRLPDVLAGRIIPAVVRRLPVSHRKVSFDYKAKRFVDGALLPPLEAHYWWKVLFTEDAKAALYANGMDGFEDPMRLYRDVYDCCPANDIISRLQHVDLKVYLPDDILVKADRMSMANSLELRVPFLDHRVVEFAASLPPRLKLRRLTKKYILRHAMSRLLPPKILRGKKRGFNVPIPIWLCRELRPVVEEALSAKKLIETGIFNPAPVAALVQDHWTKRADHSRNIWALLVFMLWYQEYAGCPGNETQPVRSHRAEVSLN